MASLMMETVQKIGGDDLLLVESMGWFFLTLGGLLVAVHLLNFAIPYGRHSWKWGLKIPAKMGWFFMEMPSFVVPLYLVFNVGGAHVGKINPNIVLLGMFILHYFNRVFLFSLFTNSNPMPLTTAICSFTFTSANGYMQARYLTQYLTYDLWWFADPRFVLGHLIFLFGMAANIHSDAILRGLRRPGETGYKIPKGGMFEFVSGANYFGESLEWTGYAIACWSWPGFVMAAFTTMFLGTRALQHHRFYQQKFEDYPKNRKAFIPFIV